MTRFVSVRVWRSSIAATICSAAANQCGPYVSVRASRSDIGATHPFACKEPVRPRTSVCVFASKHQSVRLQGTISTHFFHYRGINAAILLGQIPGGTEPMWSRFFCTRLKIKHGRHFARLLSTAEHRLTQAQFSERDHIRATRASLLVGNSPGPREAHPRALKHFSYFSFFFAWFCLLLNQVKVVPYCI